jgi:starch-binding outer membrane protein SusE/F
MKKKSLLYFLVAGIMILASCTKEEVGPVIQDPTAPVITAPATGLVLELSELNAADTITFTWSAATDYGFAAAVSYKVQLSLPGDNFGNPLTLISSTELGGQITKGELNNMLMAAELAPSVAVDLQVRVAASVSDVVPSAYSEALTMSVKPYRVIVNYPKLYVPGSYQGWAPDKAPVLSSLLSNEKYEGYIWFADANTNFKFTAGPNWDKNWGDDGADGTMEPNGANIVAVDPGFYKINVDVPALTYTFLKTTWGFVGDATGSWDVDQLMTFDAATGTLSKTLDLAVGKIKFRANGAWDINLGDNKTNLSLEYGGDDIPIATAGNYTITLDLRGPIYTYVIVKN